MRDSNGGTAVKPKEHSRGRARLKKPGAPMLKNRQRETLSGLVFFLPWIIGFLAITCYPLTLR